MSLALVVRADARRIPLPDESVQCVVTSPPYWGLRDYGLPKSRWGAWLGTLGLEPTPEMYVQHLVRVFREVRRVLREDGTVWLNLGDSYARAGGPGWQGKSGQRADRRFTAVRDTVPLRDIGRKVPIGLKEKDLVGIPWRVAFALQADGWYLRSDIIWHKPNPMPESVTDRPTRAHEYLFLLTKQARYYYNAEAIKEPISAKTLTVSTTPRKGTGTESTGEKVNLWMEQHGGRYHPEQRNKRSVWTVSSRPFRGAHFATFPPALIEPCILAGSKRRQLVLDPFGGSGTVAMVAQRHLRRSVVMDLNHEYCLMAQRRIAGEKGTIVSDKQARMGRRAAGFNARYFGK